jgi:hypothetical protein
MGWVVNATPRPLYPREIPGTHCIGGKVGPRAGYGRVQKMDVCVCVCVGLFFGNFGLSNNCLKAIVTSKRVRK